MKKIYKSVPINYPIHWVHGVKISEIRKDLDEIEKLGATHVNIFDSYDENGNFTIETVAHQHRLETDDEYTARKEKEKIEKEHFIKKELELYEKLNAKYGVEKIKLSEKSLRIRNKLIKHK